MMSIRANFRITGLILAFTFLTVYGVFFLRSSVIIDNRMDYESGDRGVVFVELMIARKQEGFRDNYYFFTYSGTYKNHRFTKTEQVSSNYFHSNSEGKNVEAYAYYSHSGKVLTHLRENDFQKLELFESIQKVSLYSGLIFLGLFFLSSGRPWTS